MRMPRKRSGERILRDLAQLPAVLPAAVRDGGHRYHQGRRAHLRAQRLGSHFIWIALHLAKANTLTLEEQR